jgi:hypothetical protein
VGVRAGVKARTTAVVSAGAARAQDVTATQVSGWHFIPEEAPRELTEILAAFLDPDR